MPADQELVLIFGALHLVALAFGALLLTMFLRSEALPAWRPPDEEDDGGGGDGGDDRPSDPPAAPSPDGIPLAQSAPASLRLRDHGRLADRREPPQRRRDHAPARGPRVPA